MLRFLAILFLALHAVSADEEESKPGGIFQKEFDFYKNLGGSHCSDARKKNTDEDVRLWCINEREGFWGCSQMCTKMLYFEPSSGKCRSDRCNFYDLSVPYDGDGLSESLKMSDIAEDKMIFFVFGPQLEGVGEYSYAMMHDIQGKFKDDLEVLFLPINPFETEKQEGLFRYELHMSLEEYEPRRVRVLPVIDAKDLGSYPFLHFVRTLLHTEGYPRFDVYIDRPVIFVINKDGTQVRRLVTPHMDTILDIIAEFNGENVTKIE